MKKAYILMTHNPDEGLVSYVESLISACVSQIIIVNNASDAAYQPIYDTLGMYPGCTVLTYESMTEEEIYKEVTAWSDARYGSFGYTDMVRIEYANDAQRESVLTEAVGEAAENLTGTDKRARVELRGVCDSVLDRFGQFQEVLKVWQPMRMRRMASA